MGVINLGALVEKLKKKLSGSGFITKTDYPSGDNAGVIKVDSTYATEVTTGGKLKAKAITAASYSEANDGAFISKETLDNLITAGALGGGGVTIELNGTLSAVSTSSQKVTKTNAWSTYTAILAILKGEAGTSKIFGGIIPVSALPNAFTEWEIIALSSKFYFKIQDGDLYGSRNAGDYGNYIEFYGIK